MTRTEIGALLVGFVISFIVAYFVVDKFITFLKTKSMRGFAIYRIVIAVLILIFAYFKVL